jgi:hypothetical protein
MVEAGELAKELRDDLLGRVGTVFARREPFQQAGKYVQGLVDDVPRKNGWTLAEAAGDHRPDKMQRLLNHASWDEYAAMGVVRDFVVEHLTDPGTGGCGRRGAVSSWVSRNTATTSHIRPSPGRSPVGTARQDAKLNRVLEATRKGPQRGSQRPTSPRPPTTKKLRRQRATGPPFSARNGPPRQG